jgi:hypothetical protein
MPPPRTHLAGTLALLACFDRLSGGHPRAGALLSFLDRPGDLPESVPPEKNSLKYDAYLTRAHDRLAWGIAVCDRFEGEKMFPHVVALAESLGGDYRLDAVAPFRDRLANLNPMLTVSVGFDHPEQPPRLKIYLQEANWGAGLCDAATLRALAAELAPGCELPDWIPADRRVGVLTVELLPSGAIGLKAYLGGATPLLAAVGAPPSALALAADMAARSRLPGGWYYLTVRARPGQPNAYAINRIYNHVKTGFTHGGAHLRAAWLDVGRQFAGAGQRKAFGGLMCAIGGLRGVRVVPTATALEAGGRSADVYCGAWAMAPSR